MKYRNTGIIEQGVVDETLTGQEMADQFCNLAERAPEIYPTEQYQNQYDSIMNETIKLPDFKKPQPTRELIRRMLIRTARDQMFASMEEGPDKGQAVADYVKMSEEQTFQSAVSSWEKERQVFLDSAMSHWKEYAAAMKPLLDNDIPYIEKKISRWLDLVELPVGFDLSYEVGSDGVHIEIDGAQIRREIEKYVHENVDDVLRQCATGVGRCLACGMAGIAVASNTFFVAVTDGKDGYFHEETVKRPGA